jgi:hypothetical protein
LFYLEILGTEIHSGGFSLKKYEKAKLLGKDYSIYWVRYSFKETTELMHEFSDQFSYLSIFDSECIVSDYHDLLFKLQKKKTGFMQKRSGNFIRRKYLPKLLNTLRKAYSYQETKNLKEFLTF